MLTQKYIQVLLGISCLAVGAYCQRGSVDQYSILPYRIEFRVSEGEGDFVLTSDVENKGDFSLEIVDFRLEQGDLVLDFSVPETSIGKHSRLHNFDLLLTTAAGRTYRAEAEDLYGDFLKLTNAAQTQYELRWAGILERVRPFLGDFKLTMWIGVYGQRPLSCAEMLQPVFGFRQMWPHLALTASAAGIFTSGVLLKSAARDLRQASTLDARKEPDNSLVPEAARKEKRGRNFRLAGMGMLAVEAAAFWIHYRKFKRLQQQYEDQCLNRLTLIPYMDTSGDQLLGQTAVGLNLQWNF